MFDKSKIDCQFNMSFLPKDEQPWPRLNISEETDRVQKIAPDQDDDPRAAIDAYIKAKSWQCSNKTIYFFCDLHADADAFILSLLASGGIHLGRLASGVIELSEAGKEALFIIGGDCFDKGPSTLDLLNVIKALKQAGASVHLLAGNHDVRTYLGLFYANRKEPLLDHLFVRMGSKVVPLLKDIFDKFVEPSKIPAPEMEKEIKARLLPSADWSEQFVRAAKTSIKPKKLEKEIKRTTNKTWQFQEKAQELGFSFCQIYAAIEQFKQMFVMPSGEYFWFFDSMSLSYQAGSYLYVHAGMDDELAEIIAKQGVASINKEYHRTFVDDPFSLYHGVIGNSFRTKYRDTDNDFTDVGAKALHRSGIYAIVHGHRNICHGQRMIIREGMMNIECDASVDRNTRKIERLNVPGGAVVIFQKDGTVKGISTDYPFIKTFTPGESTCR